MAKALVVVVVVVVEVVVEVVVNFQRKLFDYKEQ